MKTKKELKANYKQLKETMGVFQVRNMVNNRILVDSSTNISAKWNRHQMELKFGTHRNKALQKDWNELSADSFVFEILSELKLDDNEQINYAKEVKTLEEMILEELNLPNGLFY